LSNRIRTSRNVGKRGLGTNIEHNIRPHKQHIVPPANKTAVRRFCRQCQAQACGSTTEARIDIVRAWRFGTGFWSAPQPGRWRLS
jgi:hypothetical protein